jgi:multiple sugar transport system ATP-binding protein
MGLGDRIAVLERGKVRQIGTPQEIYNQPTDTFVARFIGSLPMNLVEQDGRLVGFRPENFLPRDMHPRDGPLVSFPLRCAALMEPGRAAWTSLRIRFQT